MLKELKILNGTLDLEFNEYIYEYTVNVTDDINSLELSYELDKDTYINIRGNTINEGENIVYLDVYDLNFSRTYTLYVYKENSESVSEIDNFISSLEVANKEELSLYKVQILSISVFLTIIILFSFIFKRTKKSLQLK